MFIKVGINGFGCMGCLFMWVLFDWDDVMIVYINDFVGDVAMLVYLLMFDFVYGCWYYDVGYDGSIMVVDGQLIFCICNKVIIEIDWVGCDVVIEVSGKMKIIVVLQEYLDQGVKWVVVIVLVKEESVLNVVMGVNYYLYDKDFYLIVIVVFCIINCLVLVVKVLQDNLGIVYGLMIIIYDLMNIQIILDVLYKDLCRV